MPFFHYFIKFLIVSLYKRLDEVHLVAWEQVDWRYLYHCVATWLLLEHGSCRSHKYLTCQGWVVDRHVELEVLVLSLAGNTLSHEVNAVTYVVEGINRVNLDNVSLVMSEIVV